jgi:hypothetical protein
MAGVQFRQGYFFLSQPVQGRSQRPSQWELLWFRPGWLNGWSKNWSFTSKAYLGGVYAWNFASTSAIKTWVHVAGVHIILFRNLVLYYDKMAIFVQPRICSDWLPFLVLWVAVTAKFSLSRARLTIKAWYQLFLLFQHQLVCLMTYLLLYVC